MNYPVNPPTAATRKAWILLGLILPPLATGVSQSLTPHVYSWRYGLQDPQPRGSAAGSPSEPAGGPDARTPEPRQWHSQLPGSQGYLGSIGPPPLRFMDPDPDPGSDRPPPAQEATKPKMIEKVAIAAVTPDVVVNPGSPEPGRKAPRQEQEISAGTPPSLIPDDSSPRVRPEDFLPFFQNPGVRQGQAGGSVPSVAAPPAPPTLAPSSATYREE